MTSILVVGVSHETAPVEVREQLAVAADRAPEALSGLRGRVPEAVLLSTCNRVELYVHSTFHDPLPGERLYRQLFASAAPPSLLYSHSGREAVTHLFRVAAGVDSQVLGEVQILGQVRRAWQAAHRAELAGPVLSQLFHRAVSLGKRVHSETPLSRLPASVSYAAVALARQVFGKELASRRVLVIGTGEVGEGVARCLFENGMAATVVAHRRLERAESVAHRYHAEVAPWEELPARLAEADVVISSTSAPHTILQKEQIARALAERPERPLHLIDLAVPRDIDPSAGDLDNVYLHNIDDLQAVVSSTLEERRAALPAIMAMVEAETARFDGWLRERAAVPAIREMRGRATEIGRREVEWALKKLPNLSERERGIVEAMAARIVGKLMHEPTGLLKAEAQSPHETYDISPEAMRSIFFSTAIEGPDEER
jgi:glutamyl-tRNA reductase